MSHFHPIIVVVLFCTLSYGTPVRNGENVGKFQKVNGQWQITNKNSYPYMVYIEIKHNLNGRRATSFCGGVILGRKAVLTAGHCFHGRVQATATVHAGILDLEIEKNRGQLVNMKEYLVHEKYTPECRVDRNRYCYDENDIAILWLEELLNFSPFVNKATLNTNIRKPVNQKGWILGWGFTNQNKMATMLQHGEVQVISQTECDHYNPEVHVLVSVICVKPGSKGAISADADSGGPLQINGIVYGISSHSIFKNPGSSSSGELSIFTDVAHYDDWIAENLRKGPPSKRPSSPKSQRKV